MRQVSPSLLSADFSNLSSEINRLNQSSADMIHLDIMDGVFVPNLSFGFPVIDAVARLAKKPLDVHLMIVHPELYIERFALYSPRYINVHYETCPHLHRVVQQIKATGCGSAVTINPHTPVSLLEDILPELDMVLLMSVNPGFGGQAFIPHTIKKISDLRMLIKKTSSHALIEVDGGVNDRNASLLWNAGSDILVAGSFVFGASDMESAISTLRG